MNVEKSGMDGLAKSLFLDQNSMIFVVRTTKRTTEYFIIFK